jgi:hypothetical protein
MRNEFRAPFLAEVRGSLVNSGWLNGLDHGARSTKDRVGFIAVDIFDHCVVYLTDHYDKTF